MNRLDDWIRDSDHWDFENDSDIEPDPEPPTYDELDEDFRRVYGTRPDRAEREDHESIPDRPDWL